MSDSSFPYRWPTRKKPTTVSSYKSSGSDEPIQDKNSFGAKAPVLLDDDVLMANIAQQLSLDLSSSQTDYSNDYKGTCIHAVNGVELVTDAAGVVYWPAEQTLLVADLHLEKGSSIARRGQLLPPYDTKSTLKRLANCLERWCPKRVIALGDSFHEKTASQRLSSQDFTTLKTMMGHREWIWITGNHDPDPPVNLGGEVVDELTIDRLIFRHEPLENTDTGEIAGHLHPKARIVLRGRSIRRSCFAASKTRMILPSFGAYTGGLDVLDPPFAGLFEARNFHALMRGDGQVYRIAAAELR